MMGRGMLLMPLMLLHVMLMMVFRTLLMLWLSQRFQSLYQSASLTMYMMHRITSRACP